MRAEPFEYHAMLSELEKKVIASIQGDLPISQRPFAAIAQRLAISEDDLLCCLQLLVQRGVIRRFGATLRHQQSGYEANAMTAWRVEAHRIDAVGRQMAASPHVSHCYSRRISARWPYNLYTMIHARSQDQCRAIAKDLSQRARISDYVLLFSRRELKKTSMAYFSGENQSGPPSPDNGK
jgi:DNA-binding Lrp family transcriptional regulator